MAVIDHPQTSEQATATRRLRISRYTQGDADEHFDEFEVPVDEHTTLLDALHWIQLHRDPMFFRVRTAARTGCCPSPGLARRHARAGARRTYPSR